jgi:hypothetical protein
MATPPNGCKFQDGSWLAYDNVTDKIYAYRQGDGTLWKYNVAGDSWGYAALAPMPRQGKSGCCGTFLNNEIFVLQAGGDNDSLWRYSIAQDTWYNLQASIPSHSYVSQGASLTTDGLYLYAEIGGNRDEFYRYGPSPSMFNRHAPIVKNVGAQSAGAVNVGDASFTIAPSPLVSRFATLRYSLPKAGTARLSVYDVSGQAVLGRTLIVGRAASVVNLDLRHLSNGVYVAKLTSDGFAGTQKLVVQR